MPEKKQKVLIVHNYYQIPGGEDTVVANEKKLLEENGHEVILYTRHNSELKTISKVQKMLLPFTTVFNLKTYREVRKLIEKHKVDIIHVHNTLNLVSPSVYYAGFWMKIPVVQTVHNFRLLCPNATFFRDGHLCEDCLKKGLLCAVKNKCYRGSRIQTLACVVSIVFHRIIGTYRKLKYICLTEFNKEKLLHLKQIKENNIFVKPNFVQISGNVVPYEKRKNQFIYVGRLEEIKGTGVLLEAWKLLGKEAPELLVCGKGPLEEWAREYVKNNDLRNVKLLGFLPNDRVKDLVGESKALILPTQVYEGFPVTIVEAYGSGTPVIASDLGNAGNLVIPDVTGQKFLYQSAKALSDVVKNFDSYDVDKILGIYQEKYSAEKNYEVLQKIYEELSRME